jgi:hypothetical protein
MIRKMPQRSELTLAKSFLYLALNAILLQNRFREARHD